MFCVRNEVTDKLGHNIINFDKTRFKVVVRGGFDDGGLDESMSVDVRRPVDETGGSPVGAVSFVTLMYKDSIVTIVTTYDMLVLGDALFYASSRFTNVLLVTGRAGNSINTHPTFIRRQCMHQAAAHQAAAKCADLPESETNTSLFQGPV